MTGFAPYLEWVGIFFCGGLGATCRFGINSIVSQSSSLILPYLGILVVNLLGCLAMGICMVLIPAGSLRNVLVVGFLGGFTTYASFAWLLSDLWKEQKLLLFACQLFAHLGGGIICIVIGMFLGQSIIRTWGIS